MTTTLETISNIFHDIAGVDRAEVTPEKHIFNDLGIDSLDFLDMVFDLDKAFGIKLPVEEWLAEVELDDERSGALFTIQNVISYIEAEKGKA